MVKTIHVKTIETPEEIAQSANGKKPFVKFNTRIKGKHKRILIDISEAAGEIENLNSLDLSEEEKEQKAARYLDMQNKGLPLVLNAQVFDWNWCDDNGDPLPKPTKPSVFNDELYDEQIQWLLSEMTNIFRYRATEGNPTNGADL